MSFRHLLGCVRRGDGRGISRRKRFFRERGVFRVRVESMKERILLG